MTLKEFSYGIVPLCKQEGHWTVLLIQHSRAKYWGFPKGHAEPRETPKEAAVRELLEETNLKVIRYFSDTAEEKHYQYLFKGQLIHKTVCFFVAEVEGDLQLQEKEVSGAQWLSLSNALNTLTYEIDKSICLEAAYLVGLIKEKP